MKCSALGRAEQTGGKLGYKSGSLWTTTEQASTMKNLKKRESLTAPPHGIYKSREFRHGTVPWVGVIKTPDDVLNLTLG